MGLKYQVPDILDLNSENMSQGFNSCCYRIVDKFGIRLRFKKPEILHDETSFELSQYLKCFLDQSLGLLARQMSLRKPKYTVSTQQKHFIADFKRLQDFKIKDKY